MVRTTVEQLSARAEDTALLGRNLSADPGAKTEGRPAPTVARLCPTSFGIGTKPVNPSRRPRKSLKIQTPGDGLSDVANPQRPVLHFTLNHSIVDEALSHVQAVHGLP